MIRRLFCALMALLIFCPGAQAETMPGLVRLHVIANDNSAAAQQLKLELRNTCLRCARACIGDAKDSDAAYMLLQARLDDFQSACEDRARELGYDGPVRAETGVFSFPDRVYGDLHVPAGDYRALKIIIGEGRGRNWWCILYPSLCTLDENGAGGGKIIEWLRARLEVIS